MVKLTTENIFYGKINYANINYEKKMNEIIMAKMDKISMANLTMVK
jgi:hypothetical protein